MNKNTTRVLGVVAASVLAIGTLAASSAQGAVKSVTLVYQGPLTGTDAQTGQDELLGAKLLSRCTTIPTQQLRSN